MSLEFRNDFLRERNASIFVALAFLNDNLFAFEIDVLDAQSTSVHETHPRAFLVPNLVEQLGLADILGRYGTCYCKLVRTIVLHNSEFHSE